MSSASGHAFGWVGTALGVVWVLQGRMGSPGTDNLKPGGDGSNLHSLITLQASVFCRSETTVLKFSSNQNIFLSDFFCTDLCLSLLSLP